MTSKADMQIMVVPVETLFRDDYFYGFRKNTGINYEEIALDSLDYMRRGDAEENPKFKQPIAYSLIVNPKTKKVFSYQRSTQKEKYPEERLQGKWSWGVGGHIEKVDTQEENPIHVSMLRELGEEVEVNGPTEPRVLGYINDDEDEVGKVHFGILYAIITNATKVLPKDPEIASGKFRTIKELEEICKSFEVESWSKIALDPIKQLLEV